MTSNRKLPRSVFRNKSNRRKEPLFTQSFIILGLYFFGILLVVFLNKIPNKNNFNILISEAWIQTIDAFIVLSQSLLFFLFLLFIIFLLILALFLILGATWRLMKLIASLSDRKTNRY